MIKRHRYRIYPTKEQQGYFQQVFGCCRFVYNWGLDLKITDYEKQKKEGIEKPKSISAYDISKQLTQLKKQEEFIWLNDAPSASLIHSLNHLDLAFKNFFRRVREGAETPGFPKFKSKHKSIKSFSFHQGYTINQDQGFIIVPKSGKVKMVVHRRFEGDYKTTTIIQEPSGKYYASIVVDDHKTPDIPINLDETKLLGVDHGCIQALTLSNGDIFLTNLDFTKQLKKLTRCQRKLSRKKVGSSNFKKNKLKLAKIHENIRFRREHIINNLVFDMVNYLIENDYCGLVIRKYDVKSMVKKIQPVLENGMFLANGRKYQKKRTRMILNSALYTVYQKLKNKLEENGLHALEINAGDQKTTKKCNKCGEGNKIKISLKTRLIRCKNCGHVEDIDLNAAKNTVDKYVQNTDKQGVI